MKWFAEILQQDLATENPREWKISIDNSKVSMLESLRFFLAAKISQKASYSGHTSYWSQALEMVPS